MYIKNYWLLNISDETTGPEILGMLFCAEI